MGLCYTSGTTGDPKGALYSHRSMFLHTLGENQAMGLALTETDVVMPVVPQFHAMAWGLPYACTLAGADVVMPGPNLQPAALAELIGDARGHGGGGRAHHLERAVPRAEGEAARRLVHPVARRRRVGDAAVPH